MRTCRFAIAVLVVSALCGCAKPSVDQPASTSAPEAAAPAKDSTEPLAETPEAAAEPASTEAATPSTADTDVAAEPPAGATTALPATEPAAEPAPIIEAATVSATPPVTQQDGYHPNPLADAKVGPHDWNQWGGSPNRNNTPETKSLPTEWEVGEFDDKGEWVVGSGKNIKWAARLGSQSYGNPVVANGKAYAGTNNGAGWLKRYPPETDLGCLLCFNDADGKFLWQHSSEKLPTGRVHDWPLQGICCAPLVEGDRVWFVTSRGEVACLDTEGFYDDENDGPFKEEKSTDKDEADVVWYFNMMDKLHSSQHNMCSCSVTVVGDILFVNTSNGMDESHINLPQPDAPSFFAMDKNTGDVLWTDNSPGRNILHGQWSSPTWAVLGGVPQVLFGGGDGWLYSFLGDRTPDGKPQLLWKFDCNPKDSKWALGGRATRNNIIATPVAYDGLVYVAVGEDPEHGEGVGHLWCIDPTKRGDVSSELAFNVKDLEHPIPHRREQAVIKEDGEVARANPNSAVVWHYSEGDADGDGKSAFEETMHRTIGSVAIKDNLLYVADFCGLFHCLDAKTGKLHWTHDMLAAAWGSPLIADGKVYIGDEDGDITIFEQSPELKIIGEINMGNSIYSTPIVANNILYIANKDHLFAIENKGE